MLYDSNINLPVLATVTVKTSMNCISKKITTKSNLMHS